MKRIKKTPQTQQPLVLQVQTVKQLSLDLALVIGAGRNTCTCHK